MRPPFHGRQSIWQLGRRKCESEQRDSLWSESRTLFRINSPKIYKQKEIKQGLYFISFGLDLIEPVADIGKGYFDSTVENILSQLHPMAGSNCTSFGTG